MARTITTVAAVAAVVLALSYWATSNNVLTGPTVYIRNETGALAWIDVVGLNDDGTDKMSVPPWRTGLCATTAWTWHHHGVPAAAGNGTAAFLAGPSATTTESLTHFADGGPLFARIDSGGAVHTGEPLPQAAAGCTQYSVRAGWSSSLGEYGPAPQQP